MPEINKNVVPKANRRLTFEEMQPEQKIEMLKSKLRRTQLVLPNTRALSSTEFYLINRLIVLY